MPKINQNAYEGRSATDSRAGVVKLSEIIDNVPQATETVAGKAELATQAETNTGTNDTTIVTPLKLKTNLTTPPAIGGTTPAAGTFTTLTGTTIVTDVAAAKISISGNTIDATGTDADVDLNLTTKAAGSVVFSQSKAGVDLNMQITNSDNTAADSRAGLQIAVGGSTSLGDPYVRFEVSGVAASTMTMGLDNSASDIFKISNSNDLGTSDALTLTQAGALTATTSITATLGNITATNGNIVRGTAGNKDVYSSVATDGTAGANSAGTATLAGGTITINTTAVTASSIIRLYRQGIGATGAAALGILTVGTIVASTSFVINSVQAADATALQASDVSVVAWEIVN